ncbi:MAG TPA: threonine/serine dehydratase [Rhizomicrobium sp.]|jgi:threonine dehydratase|nr:threonine/serine dehydratase [Rhizomicrobium sp.]
MDSLPTPDDILAAAKRIAPYAVRTPLIEHPELGARAGGRVFLKLEMFQRTGSFKFRGACNRILLIPEADRARGVVAFSSGNHAQGVAAVAKLLGIPATIVMPADAPRAKIEGTRALGATIVNYDRVTEDREAIAGEIVARHGATLVRPFDDPGIVAGQGTAGLEIARDAAGFGVALDAVLAPCSGGGLVTGIALALSKVSPGTKVHSVEPIGYDGMRQSHDTGERIAAHAERLSIADALMAPMPGKVPFALAKLHLAGGLAVTDEALVRAVSFAFRRIKIVAEPGGAAAIAAVLSGVFDAKGKNVALVVSGGNADPETVMACCNEAPTP